MLYVKNHRCIFTALLFFLCFFNHKISFAQLSGTYTINPSSSASATNYTSIADAIEDLQYGYRSNMATANGPGVGGPVVFKIADGTYTGQIALGSYQGVSASNNITFQSASEDSTKVILDYASNTSYNDYAVSLSGAKHITLKQLTISRSGNNSYGHAITLYNCNSINILNCRITAARDLSSGSVSSAGIYSKYSADSGIIIKNNYIEQGTYGIMLDGKYNSSIKYGRGLLIEGNEIEIAKYSDIYVTSYEKPIIRYNKLRECLTGISVHESLYPQITNNDVRCVTGIYVSNSVSAFINANYLYKPDESSKGISFYNIKGSWNNRNIISNNMVSTTGGISLYNTEFVSVLHNSVKINEISTASGAALSTNSSNTNTLIYNNIFENVTKNGIIYDFYSFIDSSGSNLFYLPNPGSSGYFARVNYSLYYYDMDDYQQYGRETGSLYADPKFTSPEDLRPHSVYANGTAKPLKEVSTDYDGDARGLLYTDMGADEFSPGLDFIISEISPLPQPYCDTTADLKIKIYNGGSAKIDSVRISILADTTKISNNIYSLALAQDTDTLLSLGKINIPIGEKLIKVFASKINSVAKDSLPGNDSLTIKVARSLKGTYTIGGSSANFKTFTDAVSILKRYGICGPVTFNVKDGRYTEYVNIPKIPGASATNRITFQSASNDSTKVQLFGYTGTYGNAIVWLDSASFITFRGITFYMQYFGGFGQVIKLSGNASANHFHNNRIIYYYTGFSSLNTNDAAIYSDNSKADTGNHFINNFITGGYYGIYYRGWPSYNGKGNVFKKNIVENASYTAVAVQYQDSFVFADNIVTYKGYNTNFFSMQYMGVAYITGNNLYANIPRYGMYISDAVAPTNQRGLIANNFINAEYAGITLYLEDLKNYDIVFNTVRNADYGNTAYFQSTGLYSSGNNTLLNNIFVQAGGSTSAETTRDAVTYKFFSKVDYNNYYVPSGNSNLIRWNSSTYSSFSSYKTASKQDANGLNIDPKFVSAKDVHASASGLTGKAQVIKGIAKDVDGDTRHSTKPDIGADEFGPAEHDVKVTGLVSFGFPACGKQGVSLKIKNVGTEFMDSVTLSYYLDKNIVSSKFYKLWLKSGNDTIITLDSITFKAAVKTEIKIVAALPNGKPDGKPLDNFIETSYTGGYSGNFKIGGYKSNFADIETAIAAIKKLGVCGPVTFTVTDSTYYTAFIVPYIPGSSPKNTITFQSESGDSSKCVLLGKYGGDPMLIFDSAQHYVFKGFTFRKIGSSANSKIVIFNKNTSNVQFLNNAFIGINKSAENIFYTSTSYTGRFNIIKNNSFKHGARAIDFIGQHPFYRTNNDVDSSIIENNIIDSISDCGIYAAYQSGLTIHKNKITGFTDNVVGIYTYLCKNKLVITQNYIDVSNPYYDGYGIDLSHCGDSLYRSVIANNMIVGGGSGTHLGIDLYNCTHFDVVHNSVNLNSDYGVAFRGEYTSTGGPYVNNRVYNNIFSTLKGGYAMSGYLLPASKYIKSDHNNLYVTAKASAFVLTNVKFYYDFDLYKSETKQDSNSISVNPGFKSNTDLHVSSSALNAAAKPFSFITTDFDGEKRSTRPDIGADEFVIYNDLAINALLNPVNNICGDSFTKIAVVVENRGDNKADTIALTAEITGSAKFTYNKKYIRNVPAYEKDTFILDTFINTYKGGNYNIKVYSGLKSDEDRSNDTITKAVKINAIPGAPVLSDLVICDSGTVSLYASENGLSTHWFESDTSKLPLYTGETFKTPVIKSEKNYYAAFSGAGCYSPRTKVTISVSKSPKAIFSTQNVCLGEAAIINNSTSDKDSIFDYKWYFGDGTAQSIFSPMHIYKSAGIYNIKLVAKNKLSHCADSVTHEITIYEIPAKPKVRDTAICGFQPVRLIIPSIANTRTKWFAGEKSDSVIHIGDTILTSLLTSDAEYYLAHESNGCLSERSHIKISVAPLPVARFSLANICEGETALFNNMTDDPDSLFTYKWNFGDSTTQSIFSPGHIYKQPGKYKVKLVVSNKNGNCPDSATHEITVFAKPDKPVVKDTSVCGAQSVLLVNQSKENSATLWYSATKPDSVIHTGDTLKTPFLTASATYFLQYTSNGCYSDLAIVKVNINAIPEVSFNIPSICLDESFKFINTSNDSATALSYMWYFGDGETSSLKNPTYAYNKTGTYEVVLIGRTQNGCTDSMKQTITVSALPVADFSAILKNNRTYQLLPKDTMLKSYSWNFGDGNSGTATKPLHTFQADGFYNISLTVTDSNGCTANYSMVLPVSNVSVMENAGLTNNIDVFPNPFSSNTNIVLNLKEQARVKITLYDITGREYAVLLDKNDATGQHNVSLQKEQHGILPGIYIVKTQINKEIFINRIICVR